MSSGLMDGALGSSLEETAAVKLSAERNRVVSEGARAAPVAASMAGRAGSGEAASLVSGGDTDSDRLVNMSQSRVLCPHEKGSVVEAPFPRR